ncbi:MAG TPA: hypothetical protein VF240_15355 [Pyrinomonadaceae bacterium]
MMPFKRASFPLALFVALCLVTLGVSCGRGGDDDEDDDGAVAETTLPTYSPTGKEGTLQGTISFNGAAPAPGVISMDADSKCASSNPDPKTEDMVVADGKLQNAFVYISEGKLTEGNKALSGLGFAAGQPAVLDQQGCQYRPHVIGVMTRQKVNITNSDQTAHNVNVQATKNDKLNPSQPASSPPIVAEFKRPETLIPVKCNQHPWMKAYIGVLGHPFFAVTGPDGSFEIKGLPPGAYTLVAWHEKLKEQKQQITVGPSETKSGLTFTFNAATASDELDGGSLRVMPALEIPFLGGQKHH